MAERQVVHVADDDEGVRHSLAFLLDSAELAVRTYGSALALLEAASCLPTGCILTDVRMPDMDGLALQQRLLELGVRLPLIMMTGHADVPIAVQALKAGAFDFIEKPFDDERLLGAVHAALERNSAGARYDAQVRAICARMEALTPREREVLDGLVAGQANKEIALDLGMSPRTVEVHRARVMEKMAAQSLSELVRIVLTATPHTTAR